MTLKPMYMRQRLLQALQAGEVPPDLNSAIRWALAVIDNGRHEIAQLQADSKRYIGDISLVVQANADISAECERLRERVAWFEKSGGVTVHTLVHQQRRQLTECRRLLRIVVELHDSIAVREHSIPQEWIEAARAATEE